MTGPYDDIIHLPHHRSKTRSHMSMHDRAAQFSPFAALTGFDSAISETGRTTDIRPELEEYENNLLDRRLAQLQELLPCSPEVTLTFFLPDRKKDGGTRATLHGRVRKIDLSRQRLHMEDGSELALEDILRIECSLFEEE